jgi:hypothetical protein
MRKLMLIILNIHRGHLQQACFQGRAKPFLPPFPLLLLFLSRYTYTSQIGREGKYYPLMMMSTAILKRD